MDANLISTTESTVEMAIKIHPAFCGLLTRKNKAKAITHLLIDFLHLCIALINRKKEHILVTNLTAAACVSKMTTTARVSLLPAPGYAS